MAKPFIIITGPQATGKSAQACRAFQDSYAYETTAANLHFYKRLLKTEWKDLGLRFPKRVKVVDLDAVYQTSKENPYVMPDETTLELVKSATRTKREDGSIVETPISQHAELLNTVNSIIVATEKARSEGQPIPYKNFILDEANEFLRRIDGETPRGDNKFESYLPITNVVMHLASRFRKLVTLGVGVCFVMHDRDYDEKKGAQGGPEAVTRGISKKLVQASDGAIQRLVVNLTDADGKVVLRPNGQPRTKAIWVGTRDEQWDRKLRGLLPEDDDKIADLDLIDILTTYCDFDM